MQQCYPSRKWTRLASAAKYRRKRATSPFVAASRMRAVRLLCIRKMRDASTTATAVSTAGKFPCANAMMADISMP